MITIDLHDYYPHELKGTFTEVSEEVAAVLKKFDRQEVARQVKEYRYRAYYSLDQGDGIEHAALRQPETPEEILEREYDREQLYAAIACLPDKQAQRVRQHFILGRSIPEIAEREGVNVRSVRRGLERALADMEKYLKKVL